MELARGTPADTGVPISYVFQPPSRLDRVKTVQACFHFLTNSGRRERKGEKGGKKGAGGGGGGGEGERGGERRGGGGV